jgi:yeast amino acid transporter
MSVLEKDNASGTPPMQYDAEKTGYTDDGLVRGEAKAVSTEGFPSQLQLLYSRCHSQGANVVVLGGLDAHSPDGVVQRRLKARHVQMVSDPMHVNIHTK